MDAVQIAVTVVGAGSIAIVLLFFFSSNRRGNPRNSN
jgi:hypothetical protein